MKRDGFTLIEIAVALAIMGVGVVTCLQIFTGSIRLQDRASRQTRAVLAARVQMDTLMNQGELQNFNQKCTPTAEGYRICASVQDCPKEKRDLDFSTEVSLRCLEIDVTWQDGTGDKSYVLKTMKEAPVND